MGFNQLDNCPKCGKLFVKGIRDVCQECNKVEEEEYKIVTAFLRDRENRKATIYEVSEATEVTIKQITKFIRQGRISMEGLPNMGYPCESCGQMTKEGNVCSSCRSKLSRDVNNLMQTEKKRQEEEKHKPKDAGYRQIKDRFK
jgi:flagellar operon protein (TIGR03826 family)